MYSPDEDAKEFGADAWIYCNQHMRPHRTGWCTVSNRNKVKLDAKSIEQAYAECRQKGYELYDDKCKA